MRNHKLKSIDELCPVCHSPRSNILYTVDSEKAVHHIVKDKNDQRFFKLKSIVEELWQQQTCDVNRCVNCSFCFAYPYVAANSEFYALAYSKSTNYSPWKWEYHITYETLINMVLCGRLKNFKLLEIGAGDGAFIKKVAPKLTPKKNVLCTEYSEYGRNEINKYGIECIQDDIRNLDSAVYKGNFDVICMFQVLEHMDNLDYLFERLNWLTNNHANLFIAVPNSKQREFYDLNGLFLDIPPVHIGRWTRKSFNIMAHRYGWVVARHEIQPQSFLSKANYFIRTRYKKKFKWIRIRSMRRFLNMIAFSLYGLHSLSALVALRSGKLGLAQWVHLRKACLSK